MLIFTKHIINEQKEKHKNVNYLYDKNVCMYYAVPFMKMF